MSRSFGKRYAAFLAEDAAGRVPLDPGRSGSEKSRVR
jgi:hypothetical protein